MSGNVEKARRLLPLLQQMCGGDGPYDILPERIGGIVQRADSVAGVSSLDKFDFRGWHYVLNSSLLLTLSNAGFKDGPMYGRFAFLYESYAGCRECIQRLKSVMKQHLDISVPQVFFLSEFGSMVMAQALARSLGYDLSKESLDTLEEKAAGQILWAHSLCWTKTYSVAADVVSYLYQFNATPWDSEQRPQQDGGEGREDKPDETLTVDPAVCATKILEADPAELNTFVNDMSTLLALARAGSVCPASATPGAPYSSCTRGLQFASSPVQSARFP
ncbi:hypothetical protein EMCG_02149 [[Emmonsia] crescens]|uniref:Uncharacterized protein n=1 Tax=[Emmonsia] crescens TaxID=73230 RepID=A0A0G2J1U2_9EURO|nr:hypothetical protein EMCG_02149 [Emmonsia crescens UAMH 3008]